MSVLEELAKLKQEVHRAQTLRASAVAGQEHATRVLEDIDGKLRGMGIEPDQAEQQLADLEQQLAVQVETLRQQVASETAAYETIVAQTKSVTW